MWAEKFEGVCSGDGVVAIVGVEFSVEGAELCFDGVDGHEQGVGDRCWCHPVGEQCEHRVFSFGECDDVHVSRK